MKVYVLVKEDPSETPCYELLRVFPTRQSAVKVLMELGFDADHNHMIKDVGDRWLHKADREVSCVIYHEEVF